MAAVAAKPTIKPTPSVGIPTATDAIMPPTAIVPAVPPAATPVPINTPDATPPPILARVFFFPEISAMTPYLSAADSQISLVG